MKLAFAVFIASCHQMLSTLGTSRVTGAIYAEHLTTIRVVSGLW
jgi:hypothetical protein